MITIVRHVPHAANTIAALFVMVTMTSGCHAQADKVDPAKVQAVIAKSKANFAIVDGGEFQMGDFGEAYADDKLPLTRGDDNKPLHKVKLSNFLISKYKVTYGDYDTYALANNLPLASTGEKSNLSNKKFRKLPKSDLFPAPVLWEDARAYCKWLGGQLGQAMDLPTEAQWEYAARARGQFFIYATDNGRYDKGRNNPTEDDVEKMSGDIDAPISVGLYPPNPLGLFDMGKNGREWVKDWYSADYYAHSPVQDPQGPEIGTKKVVRSNGNFERYPAMTMERQSRMPNGYVEAEVEMAKQLNLPPTTVGNAFRCASNMIAVQK